MLIICNTVMVFFVKSTGYLQIIKNSCYLNEKEAEKAAREAGEGYVVGSCLLRDWVADDFGFEESEQPIS